MNRSKNARDAWRSLCADLREDDGTDPRKTDSQPHDNHPRIAGRLCKQVERIIQLALQGSADDQLRELPVTGVEPAPDLTRLQVSLDCSAVAMQDIAPLRDKLARFAGFVRSEIAREINRKRTPALVFVLMPGRPPQEEVQP